VSINSRYSVHIDSRKKDLTFEDIETGELKCRKRIPHSDDSFSEVYLSETHCFVRTQKSNYVYGCEASAVNYVGEYKFNSASNIVVLKKGFAVLATERGVHVANIADRAFWCELMLSQVTDVAFDTHDSIKLIIISARGNIRQVTVYDTMNKFILYQTGLPHMKPLCCCMYKTYIAIGFPTKIEIGEVGNRQYRTLTSTEVEDYPVSMVLKDNTIVVSSIASVLTVYQIFGHNFKTCAKRYFEEPCWITPHAYPRIMVTGSTHSTWVFDVAKTLTSDEVHKMSQLDVFKRLKSLGVFTQEMDLEECYELMGNLVSKKMQDAVNPALQTDPIMALRFTCPSCMMVRPAAVYTECNHIVCTQCMPMCGNKCMICDTEFEDTKFLNLPDLKLRYAILDMLQSWKKVVKAKPVAVPEEKKKVHRSSKPPPPRKPSSTHHSKPPPPVKPSSQHRRHPPPPVKVKDPQRKSKSHKSTSERKSHPKPPPPRKFPSAPSKPPPPKPPPPKAPSSSSSSKKFPTPPGLASSSKSATSRPPPGISPSSSSSKSSSKKAVPSKSTTTKLKSGKSLSTVKGAPKTRKSDDRFRPEEEDKRSSRKDDRSDRFRGSYEDKGSPKRSRSRERDRGSRRSSISSSYNSSRYRDRSPRSRDRYNDRYDDRYRDDRYDEYEDDRWVESTRKRRKYADSAVGK